MITDQQRAELKAKIEALSRVTETIVAAYPPLPGREAHIARYIHRKDKLNKWIDKEL